MTAPRQKPLTRKEALATLYRLYDTYVDVAITLYAKTDEHEFYQQEPLRQTFKNALKVFTLAVHGPDKETLGLCQRCYLRYSTRRIWYQDEKKDLHLRYCCDSCFQQFQQEYTLLTTNEVQEELERRKKEFGQ